MEPLKLKERPLYNSRIIDTYIKLIKSKYNYVKIGELLDYAGMKPYEVADQGHWFSQQQVDRFYEKLVQVTNNENIAREAGRYAASPDALGAMRQYALGLIGPLYTFEIIKQATSNLVRSSIYESRRLSSNKVEIVVTPCEEGLEKQFQCENRTGFFEAIVTMFNYKIPEVQHPECMFRGGNICRYIVTWENTFSFFIKRIRDISTLVLVLANLFLFVGGHRAILEIALPVSLFIICLLAVATERSEKKELMASLDNTKESVDELLDQININYNNALMTNEIGMVLSGQTNTRDIIENVILVMEKRLDYDRGLILMANAERTKLELKAGYGYSDELLGFIDKVSFQLDRPESKGMFVLSFREQKPLLVNDLNDVEETLSARSLGFARKLGAKSFICCPIICEDRSLGVLAVDNVKSKRPLVQSDMSLLMGFASVIGISLRNAEHSEAKVRQFNSVLQALAASIDARDSLTAGHSEKVTEYALGICKDLDLSWEYCEMIRVASLLHDYGKIGVPDAILKKEGLLTAEEYDIVKTHSAKTKEILSQINFEGIYCEVPDIAGSHHEKVDGTGYPRGIKGKEIPLGAKIIAVADYFEAITAKRHYREPMQVEEAFQVLRGEIGKHFEKKLVEALIRYYTKTYMGNPTRVDDSKGQRGPRVPLRTEVSLRCNGKVSSCISEDVGLGGMFVAADDHATEGLPVELTINLPSKGLPSIEARGRIAWVNDRDRPKKPDFPSGYGVEFLGLTDSAANLFKAFVSSYIAANSPMGNN